MGNEMQVGLYISWYAVTKAAGRQYVSCAIGAAEGPGETESWMLLLQPTGEDMQTIGSQMLNTGFSVCGYSLS
jgi:hypothetical protein